MLCVEIAIISIIVIVAIPVIHHMKACLACGCSLLFITLCCCCYYYLCITDFSYFVTKYLTKDNLKEHSFVRLSVQRSVIDQKRYGEQECPWCWPGSRTRRMPVLSWPCPFPFVHSQRPVHETVLPTFSVGLPFSVRPLWKHFHRHAQRCASMS